MTTQRGRQRWVEDDTSWKSYGGLSITERLDRLKTVLKEGVDSIDDANSSPNDVLAGVSEALQEAIPEELRPKLPWSALVNLINAGLCSVGWGFDGPSADAGDGSAATHGQPTAVEEAAPSSPQQYKAALEKALDGVQQWLPESAVNHAPAQTVEPSQAAPELSHADYQAMMPVRYPDEPIIRVITDDFPRRPYRSRDKSPSRGRGARDVHWGQRKLFMNEVEVLTLHSQPGDLVIYAGAAPGTHIRQLSEYFFPQLDFVLVDPAPFDVRPSDRITLVSSLMTDELAQQYAGRDKVIFLSDIRRTYASEDLILEDMNDQQRWHDIIRPKVSMLKFRLPWRPGKTEYLDGTVYTQPYIHGRSTETRLIVQGHGRKLWDNQEYEERCFFFNTVVRVARHYHGIEGAGLDNTWDHAAEVEILRAYLLKMREEFGAKSTDEQNEDVARLSVQITEDIGGQQAKEWLRRIDGRLNRSSGSESGRRSHKRRRERRDSDSESLLGRLDGRVDAMRQKGDDEHDIGSMKCHTGDRRSSQVDGIVAVGAPADNMASMQPREDE